MGRRAGEMGHAATGSRRGRSERAWLADDTNAGGARMTHGMVRQGILGVCGLLLTILPARAEQIGYTLQWAASPFAIESSNGGRGAVVLVGQPRKSFTASSVTPAATVWALST